MPKKTKIIFIVTFIIILVGAIFAYWWFNRSKTATENEETSSYQNFNPFGTGEQTQQTEENTPAKAEDEQTTTSNINNINSKFHQITDFAVAGATFLEDTRLKDTSGEDTGPKEVKVSISSKTVEGRKEIQEFLNKELSLNPPLVVDGVFGKKVTQAVKDFQKSKGLEETGIIDDQTSSYFVKTVTITLSDDDKYEQAPSIRYVERKNGNIYKMFLDTGIKSRISNSTIPSIYEAFFDKTGDTVIYRYLSSDKTIETYTATLGAATGEFLPENIMDLITSYDKTKFFYLTKINNEAVGSIKTFGNSDKQIIFEHPFTEWLSQWNKDENIFLTTKASYNTSGSVFYLSTNKKTITKVLGGIAGLTTLVNPNSSYILYNYTTNSGPKLSIYNIKNRTTDDLGIYGLPEKCIWSDNNIDIYCAIPNKIQGYQYPDYWYQGLVSFDDYFVKINILTGGYQIIANSQDETAIDGVKLFLDDKESSLFFINKKDSTLWSLDLD